VPGVWLQLGTAIKNYFVHEIMREKCYNTAMYLCTYMYESLKSLFIIYSWFAKTQMFSQCEM